MWADPGGGYAILILLVLGVLGAALAPGGLRNRQRAPQRIVAAALLIGAALTLLWPSLSARMTSRAATAGTTSVAGIWVYGVDTLSMDARGTYVCRGAGCVGFGPRGTWHLGDDGRLVARWNDGHEVSWSVVRYNGRDRLGLTPAPGAGATWESGLTFMRVSP